MIKKKVIGWIIVTTIIGLLAFGVFYNADYVFRWMTGKKFYTEKQYNQNYIDGYDKGIGSYPELYNELNRYKELYLTEVTKNGDLSAENKELLTNLNNKTKEYEDLLIIKNTLVANGETDKATIANLQAELEDYKKQLDYYVTIYEKVQATPYIKVTFVSEGENFAYSYVESGKSPVLYITPNKEGHTFEGWTIDGENVVDITTYTITEDITFVAKFSPKSYAVKFMVDNNEHNTQSVLYKQFATEPTKPTKQGYKFVGWTKDGENIVDISTCEIVEDTNFIAKFVVASYNVNFVADGVNHSTQSVVNGQTPTVPTTPTKSGYKFVGWSLDGTNIVDVAKYVVTGETTFTAVWVSAMNGSYAITLTDFGIIGTFDLRDKAISNFVSKTGSCKNGLETATANYVLLNGYDLTIVLDLTVTAVTSTTQTLSYTLTFNPTNNTWNTVDGLTIVLK